MASKNSAARAARNGAALVMTIVAVGRPAPLRAAPADSVAVASRDSTAAPRDSTAVPQRDIPDVLARVLHKRVNTEYELTPKRGLALTLLPSVGYNPSYGAFLGVSVAMGGWMGDPATTTPSAGSAGASYSTTGQISVQVKTDFYTPDNGWALKGDWRYLDTNQSTYGLGPATREQTRVPMDFVLYRFYETVLWHVPGSSMFTGLGLHFDRWDKISENVPPGTITDYQVYSGGIVTRATAGGVSYNVLYDTRDNPVNAQRGTFWYVSLRSYQKELGSDTNWQGVWSDLRVYPRIPGGSRNTLAIWNYNWFTFGDAPYLDLPATGWDTYGRGARGWLQGRIRGKNQIYAEAEYRAALTANGLLGAVVFANVVTTTTPVVGQFGPFDQGYGFGARIKFNKHNGTNLGVDLAWDLFGNPNVFFGMQEVF
jgi:hypothetical protein